MTIQGTQGTAAAPAANYQTTVDNKKGYTSSGLTESVALLNQSLGAKTGKIVLDTGNLIATNNKEPLKKLDKTDLAAIQTASQELQALKELQATVAKIDITTKALAKELPTLRETTLKTCVVPYLGLLKSGVITKDTLKTLISSAIDLGKLEIDKNPDLANAKDKIKNSALSTAQKDALNKKIDNMVSDIKTRIQDSLEPEKLLKDAEGLAEKNKLEELMKKDPKLQKAVDDISEKLDEMVKDIKAEQKQPVISQTGRYTSQFYPGSS